MWGRNLAESQHKGPVSAGNAAPLGDPALWNKSGSLHGVEPCIRWRGVNRDELVEVAQQCHEDGWLEASHVFVHCEQRLGRP